MGYLLARLGFVMDDHSVIYLDYLGRIANIYKKLGAIKKNDLSENDPKSRYYILQDEFWVPESFGIVDLLYLEYSYKRKLAFNEIKSSSKYISATDLANYTYCPVGYSISKSFTIPINILAEKGVDFHEEHRLINNHNNQDKKEGYSKRYINDENQLFFDEINSSKLIFSGHNGSVNNYFINDENGFIGQPDYILKNTKDQLYVVEEKFKPISSKEILFSNNHKIQLAAYIYYLSQYKIEYGYLVYWTYSFYNNASSIEECHVLKIERNHSIKNFLDNTFNKVSEFNIRKFENINLENIKPKKCANCVHTIICSHKTKRRDTVSLPYDKKYFELIQAPYPEILSKDNMKTQ